VSGCDRIWVISGDRKECKCGTASDELCMSPNVTATFNVPWNKI